jgi:hypothetical protein
MEAIPGATEMVREQVALAKTEWMVQSPKQQCQNNGDEAGLIGSGGGAGGGGGGSYGGNGAAANDGGDGSDSYTVNSLSVSPAFTVVKGNGGSGGSGGAIRFSIRNGH